MKNITLAAKIRQIETNLFDFFTSIHSYDCITFWNTDHCNNSHLSTDLIIAIFSACKLSAVRGSVIKN